MERMSGRMLNYFRFLPVVRFYMIQRGHFGLPSIFSNFPRDMFRVNCLWTTDGGRRMRERQGGRVFYDYFVLRSRVRYFEKRAVFRSFFVVAK